MVFVVVEAAFMEDLRVRGDNLAVQSNASVLTGAAVFGERIQKGVNEIVIFSVGSRSAMSIPSCENPILVEATLLDGPNPGSSLFLTEGLLGRSPPGEAFWPSGTARS